MCEGGARVIAFERMLDSMSHQQLRNIDLLIWTTLVALLFASFTLAPLMAPPIIRPIRALLASSTVASLPFALEATIIID